MLGSVVARQTKARSVVEGAYQEHTGRSIKSDPEIVSLIQETFSHLGSCAICREKVHSDVNPSDNAIKEAALHLLEMRSHLKTPVDPTDDLGSCSCCVIL